MVRQTIAALLVLSAPALSPRMAGAQDQSLSSGTTAAFHPYIACSIPGGPSVVEASQLADGVNARTVTTVTGSYSVSLLAGIRVMFAYPGEEFYANVKVERLPADGYAASKTALIGDFDRILASGETVRNTAVKSPLNGFDIRGQDRSARQGGVLGIYLLFDDSTQTVVTVYFLNQEKPHFSDMTEYAALRDNFLRHYTGCLHVFQKAVPAR